MLARCSAWKINGFCVRLGRTLFGHLIGGLDHGVGHLTYTPTQKPCDSGLYAQAGKSVVCNKGDRLSMTLLRPQGSPSTGLLILRMPCSAMWISQAALQRTDGQSGGRTLVSFCMAPVANAAIYAADGPANLQVFCREKSGCVPPFTHDVFSP